MKQEENVSARKFLTIDDLIDAFVEELSFRNAHEDLRQYYKQRLHSLMKLFKCDLYKHKVEPDEIAIRGQAQEGPRSSFTKRGDIMRAETIAFFERCLAAQARTKSPFKMGVYLEGAHPKIVSKLEEKYGHEINGHEKELDRLNRVLLKEVLKSLFPGIDKRNIAEAKLFEMGVPKEAPDLDDYW